MDINIFGVPTHVDSSSWVIVVLIFFWGLPYAMQGLGRREYKKFILGALAASVGTIIVTFFHEFCHAIVANKFGIPIVAAGLDWRGAFVRPDLGVQISAFQLAVVAIVGPLSSACVALAAGIINALAVKPGPTKNSLHFFAMVNLKLAAFNMLPFGHMDGNKVYEWFTNATALNTDALALGIFGAVWAFAFFFVFVFADPILKKF